MYSLVPFSGDNALYIIRAPNVLLFQTTYLSTFFILTSPVEAGNYLSQSAQYDLMCSVCLLSKLFQFLYLELVNGNILKTYSLSFLSCSPEIKAPNYFLLVHYCTFRMYIILYSLTRRRKEEAELCQVAERIWQPRFKGWYLQAIK